MLAEVTELHNLRAIANPDALPFPNSQFDVVMSARVIETVVSWFRT